MSTEQKLPMLQVLKDTPPISIADLPMVQEKFIANYNACHKDNAGELMYHRNVVHFKQAIQNSADLQKCEPLSLYACFVTAAVNGYSLDAEDDEVYIIPLKGKAYLWPQAGAKVRKLMRSGQVKFVEQAKIVYQGDEFEVVNGRGVKHVEKFASETMVAAYVKFILDDAGNDKYFIYRKSDWEAWKKKSQQSNGDNWNGNNGQPGAAFLRTKVVKHACEEKCWAVGSTPATIEKFDGIEINTDTKPTELPITASEEITNETGNIESDDKAFAAPVAESTGITHQDDEF